MPKISIPLPAKAKAYLEMVAKRENTTVTALIIQMIGLRECMQFQVSGEYTETELQELIDFVIPVPVREMSDWLSD